MVANFSFVPALPVLQAPNPLQGIGEGLGEIADKIQQQRLQTASGEALQEVIGNPNADLAAITKNLVAAGGGAAEIGQIMATASQLQAQREDRSAAAALGPQVAETLGVELPQDFQFTSLDQVSSLFGSSPFIDAQERADEQTARQEERNAAQAAAGELGLSDEVQATAIDVTDTANLARAVNDGTRTALEVELQPFQIADIQSQMQTRAANVGLRQNELGVAMMNLGLRNEELNFNRQKFATEHAQRIAEFDFDSAHTEFQQDVALAELELARTETLDDLVDPAALQNLETYDAFVEDLENQGLSGKEFLLDTHVLARLMRDQTPEGVTRFQAEAQAYAQRYNIDVDRALTLQTEIDTGLDEINRLLPTVTIDSTGALVGFDQSTVQRLVRAYAGQLTEARLIGAAQNDEALPPVEAASRSFVTANQRFATGQVVDSASLLLAATDIGITTAGDLTDGAKVAQLKPLLVGMLRDDYGLNTEDAGTYVDNLQKQGLLTSLLVGAFSNPQNFQVIEGFIGSQGGGQ